VDLVIIREFLQPLLQIMIYSEHNALWFLFVLNIYI